MALPGALRAFVDDVLLHRNTPPDVEASLAERGRRETLRIGRPLLLAGLVADFLWWPADLLFYAGRPDVLWTFVQWRLAVAACCLTYWLTAHREPFARHFVAWGVSIGALLSGATAVALGSLGGLEHPWFGSLYLAPVATFPLLVRFPTRVVATLAMAAAVFAGFFLVHPANLHHPELGTVVGVFGFGVAISLSAGHAQYHVTRRSFLQADALHARTDVLAGRLDERTEELRALAAHVEELREKERRLLAREVHDELGQLLTGMRVELDLAGAALANGGDVAAQHARLAGLLDATLASTRSILARLRPQVLDDFGLVAALEWLVTDARGRSGCEMSFTASSEVPDLPADKAIALFRIAQEALTNVQRHARAARVEVTLARGNGALVLRVADDGEGLPPPAGRRPGSMGLVGMRERAAAVGGTFELGAGAPRGTVVTVRVPEAA